jgi:hypothetical protein
MPDAVIPAPSPPRTDRRLLSGLRRRQPPLAPKQSCFDHGTALREGPLVLPEWGRLKIRAESGHKPCGDRHWVASEKVALSGRRDPFSMLLKTPALLRQPAEPYRTPGELSAAGLMPSFMRSLGGSAKSLLQTGLLPNDALVTTFRTYLQLTPGWRVSTRRLGHR